RLELLTHASLPHQGPGRQENGNLHLSEIEITVGDDAGTVVAIGNTAADFDQEGWGVARAIDGNLQTAWGIYPQVGKPHEAVFAFKEPLKLPEKSLLTVKLRQLHGEGHLIGRARLSITDSKQPIDGVKLPVEIATLLAILPTQRTDEQKFALAWHVHRELVAREREALPKSSLVYAAAADFEPDGGLKPPTKPRTIHRLQRGEITAPKEEVLPGALSCIKTLPARFALEDASAEAQRRAALADWLTHRDNPLTWRSIVNRVWMHHFGRGLVATPNDFGRLGSLPTHPDLLDWLAVDFRDRGQSLKALHRLIVTSETYQQSSRSSISTENGHVAPRSDQARAIDADNQWLWRMQRSRLDAEAVRDTILTLSGRLDLRMGGPSDRQFSLKPGQHVTPIIDYRQFDLDSPLAQRRGIYRFLFRTLPDPFMEALDCPAGDQIMPQRTNSVTVQQALAIWNDAFVIRHAEHFAARLEVAEPTTTARVALAFRMALCREPSAAEQARFATYADRHGLANFCRVLFNLNEFVFID
ncbi:MAG TPA: DUF1553 domain-containing protein, partial [Pirellulaceae bacterium]|nr:DUF1553 domain-containing protein [Pirellulaceae bacterium]